MMIETQPIVRPGADSPRDDWSGITDPAIRRKLQNRCNQRAARRRRKAAAGVRTDTENHHTHNDRLWATSPDELVRILLLRASNASQWLPEPGSSAAERHRSDRDAVDDEGRTTFASIREAMKCSPRISYAKTVLQLEASKRQHQYSLPADHLLSLIYYNVYRGCIQNIAILGLDLDRMALDEYPSPFTPMSQTASSAIATLPPHLIPTRLQKTVAHHPQWDIFPDPQVRDNILNYGEERIDDVELCFDMVGSQSRLQKQSSDEAGCYIWGEPWSIDSWEVTDTFVRKYHWMFKGTASGAGFAASTNRWRRQRGEPEIDFEKVIAEAETLSLSDRSSWTSSPRSSEER